MTKKSDTTNCTNIEWVGRAHCEKCHVRKLMLFSELPEEAFKNLLQPIDHFIYPAGSAIYEINTQKKFIYSIRQGMVKLEHATEDGSKRIVRLQKGGSAIGLELLDDIGGYNHTAVAITKVDLCRIPLQTILQLENLYPKLCHDVREQLHNQLELADQWIVALGSGIAKQRVAQLILILNDFFANKNGEFLLLNGEDMAAMIGITIETVSRMIAEFKRSNILYKAKNNLYMCDVEALNEITQNS